MQPIRTWLATWLEDERGQGLAEYALILAMVSLVCVGAVNNLGVSVSPSFVAVANTLASVAGP